MNTNTKLQIKKIHTLKAYLNLSDDVYREMLFSFGVNSSKDLTFTEAQIFIEILEDKATSIQNWETYPKKYDDLYRDSVMASPAQLRMIEGVWREICYFDNDEFAKKSLRKFLNSNFKVADLMFLTKKKAIKVIRAILNIKKKNEECGRTSGK